MKAVLLAVCLSFIAAEAHAISSYNPTRMSCDSVKSTIDRQGAVILRYTSKRVPGLPLYDRYIASQRFCRFGEVRARASVPSADLQACTVYRCKPVEHERRFRRRLLFD